MVSCTGDWTGPRWRVPVVVRLGDAGHLRVTRIWGDFDKILASDRPGQ